jgi:hypothetical protein
MMKEKKQEGDIMMEEEEYGEKTEKEKYCMVIYILATRPIYGDTQLTQLSSLTVKGSKHYLQKFLVFFRSSVE